jgi:AraC family transcriptional regulator of adaptative response / DNA-3-methyladenine glycosylase II
MTVTLQGVATTGIYCRSTCTAQPHPRNVTRYPTSVAAEAAGYRPCLRCRPDRLPEPHLPDVAPPAVAHALVLISDGYLDTHTEDALARAVGYSGRQLRRLFLLHVGASPAFVARSRRAHFARRLLDETDLPLAALATAAGYQSTRQLHRAVTATFAFSPSELRAKRRRADRTVDDGGLRLHIPYHGPLDRARLRCHLRPRTAPGVDHLDESGVYRRTFETCGSPGLIDLDLSDTSRSGDGELTVVAHLPTMATLIDDVARCRHLLGLSRPVASFQALAGDDVLGAELAARPGLRVPGSWDRFESLIRIVIGQQVSLRGAATLVGRVAAAAGRPIPGAGNRAGVVFPDPATLAAADLDGLGLTTRRIATIRNIAGAVSDGSLDLFRFATLDDLVAGYCALPGVGPWTAHMAALRLHRHPDAFPAGDLGLRKGAARLLGLAEPLPASDLTALAERWRPHRALAAQLLWTINEEGLLT